MNKAFVILALGVSFITVSCVNKVDSLQDADYCMPTDSASLGIPKKITAEDIESDTLEIYSREGLIEKDVP